MVSQFSLLSFEFLALGGLAVILLGALGGIARKLAFLATNLVFIWAILLGPLGAASTLVFCAIGYLITRAAMRWSTWGFRLGLTAFTLLFIYMQNYDFLIWIVPDEALTSVLRTVGLSFLFFKIVHVIIDAQGGVLGQLEVLTYLNYCLNFSTFIMGPIQRYQDFYSQWYGQTEALPLTFEAHLNAVIRILFGLVKAYVIADRIAVFAMAPNLNLVGMSVVDFAIRMYAFYFYLYFNFGGYCDVAIGIGSLMGIRPPENFDKPFLSKNVSEFWLRMHRSLTLWLTDYVFSPTYKRALSSKLFAARPVTAMAIALMVTMVVSGLWHGTTLSFLIFGIVHGLYLVIQRIWEAAMTSRFGRKEVRELRKRWGYQLGSMLLTFHATAFAYVIFVLDLNRIITLFRYMEFRAL